MTIEACLRGDSKAQGLLYKQYAAKMFAVCMRYAANRQLAEDYLHDAFIRIFSKLHTYKERGSFEGWMRRIVSNICIEALRKTKMPTSTLEEEMVSEEDEDVRYSDFSHLTISELLSLIQTLPPAYRMVFNMFVLDGFSHKEIAQELGISEGTSKSNLARGRTLLKRELLKLQESNQ